MASFSLYLVVLLSIFVVVNAFMVNMALVSVVLVLLVEAWKWGKSFHLDELPGFNCSVLEVECRLFILWFVVLACFGLVWWKSG